jgi:hypothetical protein
VGDSTTIALNLTFFGTLGVAFLMFLGLFLLAVLTLVLAGAGRLLGLTVMTMLGRRPKNETLPLARLTDGSAPSSDATDPTHDGDAAAPVRAKPRRNWRGAVRHGQDLLKPHLQAAVKNHPVLTAVRKEPPVLAEDWAAAVAEADARAMARARAAAPEIKLSVRDLPGPSVAAAKVKAVAPLVESAVHRDHPVGDTTGGDNAGRETAASAAARSFTKPPAPAPLSVLDTGSLESLSGHAKVLKAKLPADGR